MVRMLLENQSKQLSFYSSLYEKIPENHFLKKVDRAVDFSFINSLLEKSYCKHFGKPAKEPEMMLKLLFLQYLYNLSDAKVIEEASYNLAFLWFLGLNPEDSLPKDRGRFCVLTRLPGCGILEKGDIYAKASQKAGGKWDLEDRGRFCVLRETPTPIR